MNTSQLARLLKYEIFEVTGVHWSTRWLAFSEEPMNGNPEHVRAQRSVLQAH